MVSPGPCLALLASVLLVACAVTPEPDAGVRFAATEQLRCHALEAAVDSLVPRRAAERLVLHDSTNAVTRPLSDQTLGGDTRFGSDNIEQLLCDKLGSTAVLRDVAERCFGRAPHR
jgi:hypothetical protein